MKEVAEFYSWSSLLNEAIEKRLVTLCKNYTPTNYCYLFVIDAVRDFCECIIVDIQCAFITIEEIANSAQRVLSCLGIATEVYFDGGYKLKLKEMGQA